MEARAGRRIDAAALNRSGVRFGSGQTVGPVCCFRDSPKDLSLGFDGAIN